MGGNLHPLVGKIAGDKMAKEQTVILVSLSPKPDEYIQKKIHGPQGGVNHYNFLPSEDHGGCKICEVAQRDAFSLLAATPHLFYPYFAGIEPDRHFRHTARKSLHPSIASRVMNNPEGMVSSILDGTDHSNRPTPQRDVPRGATAFGHTEFGPEEGLTSLPSPDAEAGTRDGRKPREAPEARALTAQEQYPIPATVEELKDMGYDESKMVLSIHSGQPIGKIGGTKEEVHHAIAVHAEKVGHTIDGYSFENYQQEEEVVGGD